MALSEGERMRASEARLLESAPGESGASRQGLLIDTVTSCAARITGAASAIGVLPDALDRIARVIRLDRMTIVETSPGCAPQVVFRWQCPHTSVPASPTHWLEHLGDEPLHRHLPALAAGHSAVATRRDAGEALREALLRADVMATLVVPVLLDASHGGRIAFDDCCEGRVWPEDDIKMLGLLAGVIGAALSRERYLQALTLAQDRIALLGRTDALTGLANRTIFKERLRQAFAASQRGAHAFAVLYVDLDRFKDVNDTLGHHTGDLLLQQVARRLQNATRKIDLVARLGGDEFAIVQGELNDSSSAGTLAEKLIELLSAPYLVDGNELRIGASIGIAPYTSDSRGPDALLAQADQALYRAKHAGRGRYRFHSDQIDYETRTQLALADALRGAAERGELEIRYQPQVELASGRIAGMETLLRWNHPSRGTLLPEDFLPIAEKAGLIQPLGRWVLAQACRQLAQWRRQHVPVPVVAVSVALAQVRMGREFVRDVTDNLAQWGLQPGDIELDVTEMMLAHPALAHGGALEELRALGVRIAIADFGAKHSSLDHLRTYRVNRLKIASGMIAAADVEPGGGAMVRAILGLARELGVTAVAEGVETEAQRRVLLEAGPGTQGQGLYYGEPIGAEETQAMLTQRFGALRR